LKEKKGEKIFKIEEKLKEKKKRLVDQTKSSAERRGESIPIFVSNHIRDSFSCLFLAFS
jgi:hypothetical protein